MIGAPNHPMSRTRACARVGYLERSANAGFFKTLVNIWQPDPKEPEPVWQRSDYVAMVIVGILLVLLIGFWPA